MEKIPNWFKMGLSVFLSTLAGAGTTLGYLDSSYARKSDLASIEKSLNDHTTLRAHPGTDNDINELKIQIAILQERSKLQLAVQRAVAKKMGIVVPED